MSRVRGLTRLALVVIGSGALLLTLAQASRGAAPLKVSDIVRYLHAGISESTILTEISTRGLSEPLDAKREADLREAGASETLVVAVRRAAPAPTPAPPPVPRLSPGAPTTAAPPVVLSQEPSFTVRTRTVRIPVSVADAKGEPMLGLGQQDFHVSEDGKRQTVTLFSNERRPLRLALALDVSGSMADKSLQVEEALKHFIDLLEPADEILVLTFSDDVRIAQDFTSDRERLGRIIDAIEPAGGTALYDAAYEAIRRVSSGAAESKAVVLVTDGVDTASFKSFDRLLDLARRSEVPVFSIGLDRGTLAGASHPTSWQHHGGGGGMHMPGGSGGGGGGGGGGRSGGGGGSHSGGPHGPREAFDAKPLLELAEETGAHAEILKGLEHYTPDSDTPGGERLKAAVESIAITLRHRYLVGYEPPEGKVGFRVLKVEVDRTGTTAHARKSYYSGS
jgi:Ca-activated chloride channel homolog